MKNNNILISVVIPTKNRPAVLLENLNKLRLQSTDRFEVVVVEDHATKKIYDLIDKQAFRKRYPFVRVFQNRGQGGPAEARNLGVRKSCGDIVLFIGDDCLANKNLILFHIFAHRNNPTYLAVQGFSPFHPQSIASEFMRFLDSSGLQANWGALRKGNAWKKDVNGFCLTTNYSIDKQTFLNLGGFDSSIFHKPAWEDVSFGYVNSLQEIKTLFEPNAVVYHWHEYDLLGFARRQFMVGQEVLNLCLKHNEMAGDMINPEELRMAQSHTMEEWGHIASTVSGLDNRIPNSKEMKHQVWRQTIHISYLHGILDGIRSRKKAWEVLLHLHTKESMVFAFGVFRGLHDDNWGWVQHCLSWLKQKHPDNWAVWALAGECDFMYKNMESASRNFTKSLESAHNEWAQDGLARVFE